MHQWYTDKVPQVSCKICLKEFYAKPSWLARGHGLYCSRTCQDLGRKTGKVIACSLCGKEVYKQNKAIEKSAKLFCTKACSLKWHNAEFAEEKHGNWKSGAFVYKKILKRRGVRPICFLCRKDDERIIVAHHIDENRNNNNLNNLVWLCRNCHHLVHNYSDNKKIFSVLIQKRQNADQ